MKIHITQSSKELLEAVGGYVFEFRGYQDVKVNNKKILVVSQNINL